MVTYYNFMKTVLVTGASGFLGHHLVRELLKHGDTKVIAILGRPEDKANELPESPNISVFPSSALFNTDFGHVDTLIHTAFTRGDNLAGLTRSLEFTEQIIQMVNSQNIDSLINISSQGIYKGLKPGEKVKENGYVEPNTVYGLAKWAVENMLKVGCKKHVTNIRMASLSANARFLDFFVESVILKKDIKVTAPHQYASIMDVVDAVNGILSVADIPIEFRNTKYNLGPGVQHSILDYAQSAVVIGQELGYTPTTITLEDNGTKFAICMDCTLLETQTGWQTTINKELMIKNLFIEKAND